MTICFTAFIVYFGHENSVNIPLSNRFSILLTSNQLLFFGFLFESSIPCKNARAGIHIHKGLSKTLRADDQSGFER
jgi:hypothetical protein